MIYENNTIFIINDFRSIVNYADMQNDFECRKRKMEFLFADQVAEPAHADKKSVYPLFLKNISLFRKTDTRPCAQALFTAGAVLHN